jgi:hypothetical protein
MRELFWQTALSPGEFLLNPPAKGRGMIDSVGKGRDQLKQLMLSTGPLSEGEHKECLFQRSVRRSMTKVTA